MVRARVHSFFILDNFLFLSSSTMALCLLPFCLANGGFQTKEIWQARHSLLKANLTKVVSWLCIYEALKRIEPALNSAVLGSTAPALVMLWSFFQKNEKPTKQKLIAMIGIVASLFYIAYVSHSGQSSLGAFASGNLTGIALAFVAGITMSYYSTIAKTLFEKKWPVSNTLFLCNLSIVLYSFIAVINSPTPLVFSDVHWSMYIFSIAGIALPKFLINYSLKKIPLVFFSFLLPLSPIFEILFHV